MRSLFDDDRLMYATGLGCKNFRHWGYHKQWNNFFVLWIVVVVIEFLHYWQIVTYLPGVYTPYQYLEYGESGSSCPMMLRSRINPRRLVGVMWCKPRWGFLWSDFCLRKKSVWYHSQWYHMIWRIFLKAKNTIGGPSPMVWISQQMCDIISIGV